MNNCSSNKSVIFQNPECKPLEKLKLVIQSDGIMQTIPALDEYWVENKKFLTYEPPIFIDENGKDIIGAKERWLELAIFFLDDLTWLLRLPFYKFWSNIVYNTSIIKSIISFLQESPIFFHLDNFFEYDIKEYINKIRKNILHIFARLMTNKESTTEYIILSEHASLLYDKYILTVPIILDLCQQYGRDNKKIIVKMINSAFALQPLYKNDLQEAALFIIKTLTNIERQFEDCPADQEGKAVLLSDRGGANVEITLFDLEDIILYLLDIVSTINIFLEIYPDAICDFNSDNFISKLISIYCNVMPEMYKRLNDLAFKDETLARFMELKHRLDITRIEIINVYRTIVYKDVKNVIAKKDSFPPSEVEEVIEQLLNSLSCTLSEKEFVIDYHNLYPITDDLQILLELNPNIDTVKCEYIVNSIFSFLDEPATSTISALTKKVSESTVGSSNIQQEITTSEHNTPNDISLPTISTKNESEMLVLISEIKDVLCDLGEGFIEKCLKHFNYNKETVINAVLEDSLPNELKNLDHYLPYIPPDPEEASATVDAAIGVQRLNIYDNDEFDVMTQNTIDTSKIHKGKRKDKYKNFNELLNDKSHIAETKNIYSKYSIITSEYDDEYDDTYDDQNVGSSAQDDVIEVDARPFTIPRILRKRELNDVEENDDENEVECSADAQINKDNFVQDPAILRAKAEERRQHKQRNKVFYSQTSSVVGNSKDQGQTKETVNNRNHRNKQKASKTNHNRRAGSQWKRNHGMVPS
ncbi:activating signal cointegrator 1 complex subunit 2 [Phymastichus coffea]|uniref:activating signal cointegrator 1 complex subunit 2 n=1 Tax=Phymastichus coffea TaxID=108790 RepID=UPI00273C92F4|nr:activating signal cointegrator 1 complex subunit 2 [Phymastichus coffea]XP_058799914.1 activating signal cointegrator 1 complex subunit 2 [Phymastichus coffea]